MKKRLMIFLISSLFLFGCSNKKINTSSLLSSESLSNETISEINSFENSSSSSEDSLSSEKIDYKRKINVYLNPSVQTKNMYNLNLGSEAENMNKIASIMYRNLKDIPFLNVKMNSIYLPLASSTKESNSFGSDIHFALHSNAGGGKGSEIYTINSKHFTSFIYNNYLNINSFPTRGIKDGSRLYELKNVNAPHALLIELSFHDNDLEAKWIVDNHYNIARNLSDSIITYSKEILKEI